MRIILFVGALALASSLASAQTSLHLEDPVLSVDGRRVATAGAPLRQDPFSVLTIQVPGDGVYHVSERPFAGARRVGQFDGDGLYFAVQGRSVRLESAEPILSQRRPVSAYVRYEPTRTRAARGPARLSVAGGPDDRSRRAANAPRSAPVAREPRPVSTGTARLRAEHNRLAAERTRLEEGRLLALRKRDRAAAESASLRRRVEPAEAEAVESVRELARVPQAEGDRLGQIRADLAEAIAAREQALDARNAATAQRDRALAERDEALLRAEVLAAGRGGASIAEIDALRAALARDRALLDHDRAVLAAERQAFDALRASSPTPPALADRQELLLRLERARTEREALVEERDRLAREVDSLRRELDARQGEWDEAGTTRRRPDGEAGVALLPGFDFGRVENPEAVRRRVATTEYPRWAADGRIEGDVLVLFQTDPTGRVVRTAVPRPLGGGLDELAQALVREMRFRPVGDQTAGLRSQVLVRFEL